jgi:alcohol dehydrogenase (cytochrome c)
MLCGQGLVESRYDDPASWLSYDRDNAARRYSPLRDIDSRNVGGLAVAWVFQFPRIPARSESTPLVRNGVMYVTVGGDEAYALDARTGRVLWHFRYAGIEKGRLTDWNRGFALLGNRLFMTTLDASLLALDARNGSLLWKVKVADHASQYSTTSAPLIVRDLVIVGVGGGDEKEVRGFLDAYRGETGERAWRFHTVPAPGQPGSETWPPTDVWKTGGAAPWTTGSYDPELNLLYWATGNPGPLDYDGRNRPGDNLYSCSLLALAPETGRLRWHFQFTPHDTADWDSNQTPVLLDADWHGKSRKLVALANRNGFFYLLDRSDGKFLLAKPFVRQTWVKSFRPDGRPETFPEAQPSLEGSDYCPDPYGGTNWQAPAYNPETGLLYVSAHDACARYYPSGPSYEPSVHTPVNSVKAIDVRTGGIRWSLVLSGPQDHSMAGCMTTSGGLVFFGYRDGNFMAADARSGVLLWHFNTGGSIRASPMTYAADGKQYVAITTRNALFTFALRSP